jgi:hypothetical protein
VAGRTDAADTLNQKCHLVKMLMLGKFLDTAVHVTNDDINIYNLFSLCIKTEKLRFFL